ncbi:hypothetical protein DY000_02059749 [Brassica cretica]|uniref:PGG domain-containing protein n=1 Tax=Brassica cretica TaxID=69181 RepID=A0ABQ7B332_BRACR|nr:hypothetical protein DY000_02059749 [Brassica cretica]
MTLTCSVDFILKYENIFLTSSNAVVFTSALTAVIFVVGVFSLLSAAAVPSGFFDRSTGVMKSSLFPRIWVAPHGRTALIFVVRPSTCVARELMTLTCSVDFILKYENIFLTSSNAVVFTSALTAVIFVVGVFSLLSAAAVPSGFFGY